MTITTQPYTTTYASFPCPDCGTLICCEGKDIHLCVTRLKIGRKVYTSREYVGHYDGQLITGKPTHHDVEVELDRHALDLLQSGLMRSATELDSGLPEWEAVMPIDAEPSPTPPRDDGPEDTLGGFRCSQPVQASAGPGDVPLPGEPIPENEGDEAPTRRARREPPAGWSERPASRMPHSCPGQWPVTAFVD